MRVEITGPMSTDPKENILTISLITKTICQGAGQDPAEAVMMLLTAAAHITMQQSKEPTDKILMTLAGALGAATVAAEGFFTLRVVPKPANDGKKKK